MSLLSAHDIEKSHGAHQVLRGVSVTLGARDRVGLVGNNGSGKTTLARVLGKLEPPDVGTVMQQRNTRIGFLAQVPIIDESATVREAALQGLAEFERARREHEKLSRALATEDGAASASEAERRAAIDRLAELDTTIERLGGWAQEHRAAAILERLHVTNLDALVGTLSGGERRRVALAALLVSEPDVLILDEPTNHLDTDSIDWLEEYLEDSYPGAVLVITHDRYFLDRVVKRTWEIERGQVQSYEGGWEAYLSAKAERQALEARTEANRQNFLRTELEWLRRQPKARGTKQKARIQRAEAALVEGPKAARGLQFEATAQRQGSEVIELSGVRAGYGERVLIDGLDLIVTPGQRIGIIGANGAGKTTLLELASQQKAPLAGSVRLGKNTRIGYFAQTRRELDDSASVAENVAGLRQSVTVAGRELTLYSYLERFMFRGEEIRKKVGVLSGGERARVALAKLLLVPCNLLLLDEPTNDLDVTALGSLEQMLCDFAGSVMVVTHDRYFLDRVATSILVFEGGGRVAHYVGDYANYASLRSERSRLSSSADPAGGERAPEPEKSPKPRPVKLTYKEQKELSEIEGVIEAAELEVSRLTAELGDPELYRTDAARAGALTAELETAQARVQALMDRWQELESKREAAANATGQPGR